MANNVISMDKYRKKITSPPDELDWKITSQQDFDGYFRDGLTFIMVFGPEELQKQMHGLKYWAKQLHEWLVLQETKEEEEE